VTLLDGELPRTDARAGLEGVQRGRGRHAQDRTDDEGRFSLPVGHSGTFWVRAYAPGAGAAEHGPLAVDHETGETGLVVALDEPLGTIEGTVRMPAGHSTDEVHVLLSSDRQEDVMLWPARDGHFRARDLAAGRWTLRAVGTGNAQRDDDQASDPERQVGFVSHFVPMPPDWLGIDHAAEVLLAPGGTETVVFDLAQPPTCVLACSLRVDGRALLTQPWDPGWYGMGAFSNLARLEREERGSWEPPVAEVQLDGSGAFRVGALEPGTYRLAVDFLDHDGFG
jgi:hypothetical protein